MTMSAEFQQKIHSTLADAKLRDADLDRVTGLAVMMSRTFWATVAPLVVSLDARYPGPAPVMR